MKGKLRSQKMNLFIDYALLITLLLSICFFIFYFYYRENIYKDAKAYADNLSTSISNSVSSEIDKMSTISMNIIYSSIIQKNLVNVETLGREGSSLNPAYASSRDSVLNIYDTISAIIGPFQSVQQINIYSLQGTCIGSGFHQYTAPVILSQKAWYEETINNNGIKYITAPESLVNMPSMPMNFKDDKFISLCRVFFDGADRPQGIVQVIQNCSTIFSFAEQTSASNPTMRFYIYNERGELIYPYVSNQISSLDYNELIVENNFSPFESYTLADKEQKLKIAITYAPISNLDWKVVVTQPTTILLQPLYDFTKYFIFIILAGIFVTLLICFVVASKLTDPLHKLTLAIKQVNINNVLEKNTSIMTCPNSSIEEIHALFNSFNSMYHKLCLSSQEIMSTKSEETRAKMSATQAMINPHFLYNNLTTISILAEEKNTDQVVFMCNALCDYFRYISASDEPSVTLQTEALYTEKYIACMQIRFGSDFSYHIQIPEELKAVRIPKLIIQPIVENAFKYAFDTASPWQLNICCEKLENRWLIHITDNGKGMTEEMITELLHKLEKLKGSREITSLKIGGMGIKNVYLRLLLLYNEQAVFELKSAVQEGTCITIGGPIIY
ncbi:cache domain-containing sensor histidine kinase [Cellulosilyticum sp. I15G10I2]|uniref:cache domain-containing sensor histidine kinase n=1 Tax=Cellulosilyticum sp. I15G10I2 TaxID=1892843 RepID=UPI00085C6101|nr:histidine kinase [Cellulosilyticum sp. I15G10I2]